MNKLQYSLLVVICFLNLISCTKPVVVEEFCSQRFSKILKAFSLISTVLF